MTAWKKSDVATIANTTVTDVWRVLASGVFTKTKAKRKDSQNGKPPN